MCPILMNTWKVRKLLQKKYIQNLTRCKTSIRNLTRYKNADSKSDETKNFDSKSDKTKNLYFKSMFFAMFFFIQNHAF